MRTLNLKSWRKAESTADKPSLRVSESFCLQISLVSQNPSIFFKLANLNGSIFVMNWVVGDIHVSRQVAVASH